MTPDDRLEQLLTGAARAYHVPPQTPREEIWEAMAARRARQQRERRRRRQRTSWGLAIAATLLLGVAIGRVSLPRAADAPVLAGHAVGDPADVYELVALDHLRRAETFLTVFLVEARADDPGAWARGPARELLTTTRLLLDSPAADEPELETLLTDLELVLAQIAQLRAVRGSGAEELYLIDHGIEQRGVLLKLRAAIDAGLVVPVAQGVL